MIIGVAKLPRTTPLRGGGHGATPTTRAKDGDRQDVCQILDNALNDGEITDQEHLERVSAATTAVALGELQVWAEDLRADKRRAAVAGPRVGIKAVEAAGVRRAGRIGRRLRRSGAAGRPHRLGPLGNTRSPLNFTTDPGTKPDGVGPVVLTPPRELLSVGGLAGLVEQTPKGSSTPWDSGW